MSSKLKFVLFATYFFGCFLLSNVVSAQVIDPCWYGCPKDGCPGCGGGGGPIKAQSSENRVEDCKKNQHVRAEDCNNYFPSDKYPDEHRECLAKEKKLFDACLAPTMSK